MRVGILSPDRQSTGGGVERFCWLLQRVLTAGGHHAELVGTPAGPRQGVDRLVGPWLRWSRAAGREASALESDILVTNGLLGRGIPRSRARIHVFHGNFVEHSLRSDQDQPTRERVRRLVGGGLAEALAGRGAVAVAVSRTSAREVRRLYGVRAPVVIPNCVDTDAFCPGPRAEARARLGLPEDRRLALFVGHFEFRKGGDFVAEGVRRGGFELMVAGRSGPHGARHLGVLDGQDLVHAYRAADCVVLPSRYEACSLVALEALACGVPLVATRVGWIHDLVEAVPSYEPLICGLGPDALAETLGSLHGMELGAAVEEARSLVLRENSLEAFGRRWNTLIERVAA